MIKLKVRLLTREIALRHVSRKETHQAKIRENIPYLKEIINLLLSLVTLLLPSLLVEIQLRLTQELFE